GGRLLAADEQPEIIEGRWDRDKIVLLSFSNATAFRGFFESAQGSTRLRPTGIWSRCVRKQTHYAHLEFCRSCPRADMRAASLPNAFAPARRISAENSGSFTARASTIAPTIPLIVASAFSRRAAAE